MQYKASFFLFDFLLVTRHLTRAIVKKYSGKKNTDFYYVVLEQWF